MKKEFLWEIHDYIGEINDNLHPLFWRNLFANALSFF